MKAVKQLFMGVIILLLLLLRYLVTSNLFEIFHEKIDENFQHICGQRNALSLAGGVEAEVHQEGGGVLQAVHGEVRPGEVLGHQPADEATLQQGPPYDEPELLFLLDRIGFSGFRWTFLD